MRLSNWPGAALLMIDGAKPRDHHNLIDAGSLWFRCRSELCFLEVTQGLVIKEREASKTCSKGTYGVKVLAISTRLSHDLDASNVLFFLDSAALTIQLSDGAAAVEIRYVTTLIAMSDDNIHDDTIISRIAHRPRQMVEGMMPILEPAKFPILQRATPPFRNGTLDRLPVELIHTVLNRLDLQSLSRLSCVSLQSKAVVEAFPPYRELMHHVPETLRALGKTRLACLHTADVLYSSLKSEQCVSCKQFGPYLFLPTCERCCYGCLQWNPSLRVIPVSFAQSCFKLTQCQLKQLGIMRSVPGRYQLQTRRKRRLHLVSVKMAKKLALSTHGSIDQIVKCRPAIDMRIAKDKASTAWYNMKLLQEASLEPIDGDATIFPGRCNQVSDAYPGLASINFPSLSTGEKYEKGLWCKGCQWTFEQYDSGRLSSHTLSNLAPGKSDPFFLLLHSARRARSRTTFVQHVAECHGARNLKALASRE